MLEGFLVSFGVVLAAELGDKSQLMALAFATRYRVGPVLLGITIAASLVLGVSAAVGAAVAGSLPTRTIDLVAGLAFLGFAVWTLRGDDHDHDEDAPATARSGRNAVLVTAGAFTLAELGDKTMLATVTLATRYDAVGTWLGAVAAMVAVDAVAIVIGRLLGRRLPERQIRWVAAGLFVLFGILLLVDAARG